MQAYQQGTLGAHIVEVVDEMHRQYPRHWQSSESNEHYTPRPYVKAALRTMGSIALDPASCETANDVVRANRYFTREENGLRHPWHGTVFMNPPYGKTRGISNVGIWAAKLLEEYRLNRTKQAIFLCGTSHSNLAAVQALCTHPDAAICITDHRIEFYDVNGEIQNQPPGNNLFIYLGEYRAQFAENFTQFGMVLSCL